MQLENLKIHGENLKILKMRSKNPSLFYDVVASGRTPIAFCNVFSKINLNNIINNLRITNAAKTFNNFYYLTV
jgi:hypothetical protein